MTEPTAYETSVGAKWQEHVGRIATVELKKPAHLVAAAGCGKTELIADAVKYSADKVNGKQRPCRELVLTHSHAGVEALRSRMRKKEVPAKNYHIDTIAGWALRYASAFPKLSGLLDNVEIERKRTPSKRLVFTPKKAQWRLIYEAATRLLQNSAVGEIVDISYTGLYVDEYQDCTMGHHHLILELAKLLPCRILGDPLQGIFDFNSDPVVNWESDVEPNLRPLPELTDPKRWQQDGAERKLGEWLAEVRKALKDDHNGMVDLRRAPEQCVFWRQLPGTKKGNNEVQRKACWDARDNSGCTTALLSVRKECYKLAQSLGGDFSCVEEMECEDLMRHSEHIHVADGSKRAAMIIDFAGECTTKVGSDLNRIRNAFFENGKPPDHKNKYPSQLKALMQVAESPSLEPVEEALKSLEGVKGAIVYRKELLSEMRRALREFEFETGKHETLKDAAWFIRNQTRRLGRRLHKRTLGTTLLLKGLEFDHVIVLDADKLRKKEDLYVALTRAKKSLTILSHSGVIRPRGRRSCGAQQKSLGF